MFANPRTGATVHIYVAPPDGLFVTSHLVETEHELTVIDAQFRPEHAAEGCQNKRHRIDWADGA
jgi:hypothetical protein